MLTEKELSIIRDIDYQAFPSEFIDEEQYSSINNYYMECDCLHPAQLFFIVKPEWYIIVTEHCNCYDIQNCAAKSKKCINVFEISNFLADICLSKRKDIYANARESTSYPLFKRFEKRGKVEILSDISNKRAGETVHFLKMRCVRNDKKDNHSSN